MGKKTKFTQEELKMMKEMDALSEKAQADPKIRNASVPDSLWHELKRDIREYEAEKRAKEQEQRNQELIKLGLVYERRRKYRKYYVLAATLVLTLALGITSFGGAEKILEIFERSTLGREQIQINSNTDIEQVGDIDEEEAYAKIEYEFGFFPVRLNHLPDGIGFQEASIFDELQGVNLIYGKDDKAKIIYMIHPNYREGSWIKDVEDELLEKYVIELSKTNVQVKKYLVENNTIRWMAIYEYKNVGYSIMFLDMDRQEIENIIRNLYFYE